MYKRQATYREDVKLPCLAVGVPAPEVTWKVKGTVFEANDRMRQLPEGTLLIKAVTRTDAGEYSCSVENSFGQDSVTHQLVVLGKYAMFEFLLQIIVSFMKDKI